MQSGYDIGQLVQEALTRWLKPAEVLFILQNHQSHQITHEAPQKPSGGSLFLFNRRVLRFFRKDGHNWRKKKDGKTAGEAHERLKVGNVEALNCYYAHGENDPMFQRRSYWMLDPAYEHIVLVHYREITESKFSPGSISELSPGPSHAFTPSTNSTTVQNLGCSSLTDMQETYQNHSSPGSVEVSSEVASRHHGIYSFGASEKTGNLSHLSPLEVNEALRRLETQLSLGEAGFNNYFPLSNMDEPVDGHGLPCYDVKQVWDQAADLQPDHYFRSHTVSNSADPAAWQESGGSSFRQHPLRLVHGVDNQECRPLNYAPGNSDGSMALELKDNRGYTVHNIQDKQLSTSSGQGDVIENLHLWKFEGNKTNQYIVPEYALGTSIWETNQDLGAVFDNVQCGLNLEGNLSLMVAQEQKFKIQEISPEWGFAGEATKVIILGSFLCQPSDYTWRCRFGDIEVPVQIIQDGALSCQAPSCPPGKVTLCITSGNWQACSEISEFEYRDKQSICSHCIRAEAEAPKSTDELLLLVRFVRLLLSSSSIPRDGNQGGNNLLKKLKSDEDMWDQLIDLLLSGNGSASSTSDWLLQELLKDKLHDWLSSRTWPGSDNSSCTLSNKEQGIVHMIAGLGYEWALNPVLGLGVGVNFRDLNGWTALHWAARFGREKMVAALVASGASPGAVTDPSSRDPRGRTPASVAAANGHHGLAGYLSESALTSHLSSLTLEEEPFRGSADFEAEVTVHNIPQDTVASGEDQIPRVQTLVAARNAALAAARIQAAFRAHSFRRRQEREMLALASCDEYGFGPDVIASASKLALHNSCDKNAVALSIQKKYKGWKGRKDFLAFRQKVVKIQAHVRGYQVRKKYKVICWAAGILEKAVLRWRRKGAGLRGFKPELEVIDENVEYEDQLKAFRKQEVEAALDEDVARVLFMVESPRARQQYHRMVASYQEAKAEQNNVATSTSSSAAGDICYDDDIFEIL